MSVLNTRKNLGTVIECAENVEDTSFTSPNNLFKDNNLKVINQSNVLSQKNNENVSLKKSHNDEEHSLYASARLSISKELQETNTRLEQVFLTF